jgi:hydroxyacid-oxoacid transhydrogenase
MRILLLISLHVPGRVAVAQSDTDIRRFLLSSVGASASRAKDEDAGRILADRLTHFMQRLGAPSGLAGVGYNSEDIPELVKGTLPQHRVTKLSPRPAGAEELARIFEDALVGW